MPENATKEVGEGVQDEKKKPSKDAVSGKVPAGDSWNTMPQEYPNMRQGSSAFIYLCSLLLVNSHTGDEVSNLPGKSDSLHL